MLIIWLQMKFVSFENMSKFMWCIYSAREIPVDDSTPHVCVVSRRRNDAFYVSPQWKK